MYEKEAETGKLALDILDHINGYPDDVSSLGALILLREFLDGIIKQRKHIYWEVIDWGKIEQ